MSRRNAQNRPYPSQKRTHIGNSRDPATVKPLPERKFKRRASVIADTDPACGRLGPSQSSRHRLGSFGVMQRRRLCITGIVQGVGFRPHLHRLARQMSLTGATGNDGRGVWCEIQGTPADLAVFIERITAEAPPLARVESLHSMTVDCIEHENEFRIAASSGGDGPGFAGVPADAAACPACLAEIRDPSDRRFGYAFTCCVDCGPRYTVVQSLPYDRERTSMAGFALCEACDSEHRDPRDRRHHAQAVCCDRCGPRLTLRSGTGETFDGEPLAAAAGLLRAGRIVAVKGVGGYQLACRADDPDAVSRLRQRKHREEKPFAVLVASLGAAGELVRLDDLSERVLSGPETPIVLAPRRESATVAEQVAPGTGLLGVMLPASPLHAMLAEAVGFPLVCTSGNRSDEPIVIDDAEARAELGPMVDAILSHDRVIERRADDSLAHVVNGGFQLLRRARGYAPTPLRLSGADCGGAAVLAVGAELKSTVCLALGSEAHMSVHLGDLEHPAALSAFEVAVSDLLELTRAAPELVVHDLHREYLSTKFAVSVDLAPTLGVQHHHAHLASCLADSGHSGAAIGLIFDGMGWGADGTLWGGEVLVGDASGYDRFAHLRAVPMPGGAAAIRQPWRMALAHLFEAFGTDLPLIASLAGHYDEAPRLRRQCQTGRSVMTTSLGRLFDAVAALCGIGQSVSYEGQAAVGLEQAAGLCERRYPAVISTDTPAVIDPTPLIAAIVDDLLAGRQAPEISGAFHRWVADVAAAAAQRAREATGLTAAALSGGVFQNRLLTEMLTAELRRCGFSVLSHRRVPPNDGGISLGQAAVGRATLTEQGCS